MASFRGSFNLANLSPSRALRPALQRRTQSSSSEGSASCGSASPAYEEQFVFSVENTPSNEYPPSSHTQGVSSVSRCSAPTSAPREGLLFGKEAGTTIISELPALPKLDRSKPIAIELPTARRLYLDSESAPADTPPEPLSARGDIPGGYFPLHEDPKSRVRRPHPFHLDASKAKHRSLNRAAASSKTASLVEAATEPSQFPFGAPSNSDMSGSHTPVSSYLPNGVHNAAALPLGKYYPSNYEKRSAGSSQNSLNPSVRAVISSATKSESVVPKYRHETSAHSRTNSEVKRRLLQYQRDMVAQATIAARALLANSNQSGDSAPGSTLPGDVTLPSNVQMGKTMIKTHKPISPRLAPLGSPGPVTPMSLEAAGDGYLMLGRSHTDQQVAAIRIEQARRNLDSKSSPISERGLPISV